MPAKFIIETRENYYAFTFYSESDNVILLSRLFRSEQLCRDAIKEIITCSDNSSCMQKLQDKIGQYSFLVRNKKGVTLGHSPVYYGTSSRDYAMRQLEFQAQLAIVETVKYKNDDHPFEVLTR